MNSVRTGSSCLEALKDSGFNFFTGVADSLLASLIRDLEEDPVGYVPAVREDLAVGLACGAFLAGRQSCVLMQNSGLGYSLNVLTSLNLIYKIPILMIVGHRGYQGKDAPEHLVMGVHCEQILREVGIPTFSASSENEVPQTISAASKEMRAHKIPAALLIRPGVLPE